MAIGLGLVLADANDDVLGVLSLVGEVVFEDALGTVGVTGLGVEGGSGVVGNHTVSTSEGVLHGAPDVVLGCGLDVPDVTRVSRELTAGQSGGNGVLVANSATGGVDEPGTLLEVLEELGVDEAACTLVQGAVHGNNVALRNEALEVFDPASVDSLGGVFGERGVVVVKEFLAVEGHETLQDTVTNTASTDGSDDLALQIECVAGDVRHLPVTTLDHLVSRDKVADEEEDAHDDVLSNGDDIGTGNLQDLNAVVDGSVEVDVVGTDTGGDTELQVLGLLHEVAGQVARVERSGDENLSIDDVLLEVAVGSFLAAGDNEFMTLRLQPISNAELVLGSAKEAGFLEGGFTTVVEDSKDLHDSFELEISRGFSGGR